MTIWPDTGTAGTPPVRFAVTVTCVPKGTCVLGAGEVSVIVVGLNTVRAIAGDGALGL